MPFLSKHALDQAARRRITRAEITEALESPDTTYPSNDQPDRLVVLGRTGAGRRLKVVVRRDEPGYVITVADRDSEE